MLRWGCCLLVLTGCGDNLAPVDRDASAPVDGQTTVDASIVSDGAPPLAWLDFTASGCDFQGGACTGRAPLSVTFHALAPSPLDQHRWRFGDGEPDELPNDEATPTHVYELPGEYSVSLAGSGPGGSNSASKPGFVLVSAAGLGQSCTLDDQCAAEECICNEGGCAPELSAGMCSARCESSACTSGVCADLRPNASSEDWHDLLCLPDCSAASCAEPLTCQDLRAKDGGWVRACFRENVLAAVGRSCTDEEGLPDDDRCASLDCLAEGARGMCSASCATSDDCPQNSACATFGGPLGKRCLARCTESFQCASDPWLACEAPGITADKGFTVDEAPAAGGYCAPKRCSSPEDCGPDGACIDDYCAAQP